MKATIFQAVNSHEALATTSRELNSIVVKLITAEDTYYDGKKVSGTFIMVDTYTYELNEKALSNYSNEDLFVYVSYGRDKDIAVNLLNKNKKLLIIDGSLGMKPDYIDELWLNPSNLLMILQNIICCRFFCSL